MDHKIVMWDAEWTDSGSSRGREKPDYQRSWTIARYITLEKRSNRFFPDPPSTRFPFPSAGCMWKDRCSACMCHSVKFISHDSNGASYKNESWSWIWQYGANFLVYICGRVINSTISVRATLKWSLTSVTVSPTNRPGILCSHNVQKSRFAADRPRTSRIIAQAWP
jgi:hypothetical protein